MKNVAVFFGGESVEHDVSVITGTLTLNSIDKNLFNPIPIYVAKDGRWFTGEILKDVDEYKTLNQKKLIEVILKSGRNQLFQIKGKKLKPLLAIAVAINCMHGERGEDGCLAGVLSMSNIPLASPNLLASSVCMDKSFTKTVMKGLKIKTLPSVSVGEKFNEKEVFSKLKLPLIVKPNSLGSSIGISKVNKKEDLTSAISFAKKFGERVIIEPFLKDFIEINCAVYRDRHGKIVVSECERPVGKDEVLSFDDKYKSGKRIFPADISEKLSSKIKDTTKKVYSELYADGVLRIDYLVSGDEIYLNEVNTVPGSLACHLFSLTLKEFSGVLEKNIRRAESDFAKEQTIKTTFKSGIINGFGAKGSKKGNN